MLHILEVHVDGLYGDSVKLGSKLKISVRIDSAQLAPEEISVELITLIGNDQKEFSCSQLSLKEQDGSTLLFEGEFTPEHTGTCRYGVRVMPVHPALFIKYEPGLVCWS